ncbi:putative cytokinetic ring protein SteA [Nocardioides sp.]|uniref:putative cytokinetic ring protein SteA n=1 Tax=Nocardioides sp. TaxID=35761 RepID=UPI003D0AFD29
MRFPARQRLDTALPGLRATARVERRTKNLLARLRPGDIAVIDHLDLDRATAQALADAEVAAVVNASAFISGRYPNLGPELLAQSGIALVDGIGTAGLAAIKDATAIRLHEGTVYVDEAPVAHGRVVDLETVIEEMTAARQGLGAQLESFTHNSTEFLRREQDLLLHGSGAPRLATALAGRPVVVVVQGHDHAAELAGISSFIKQQAPVLIGVDRGGDVLLAAGHRLDVLVVTSQGRVGDGHQAVSSKAVKAARDVVALVDRGSARTVTEPLERLGVQPLRFETGATAEDAALLLGDLNDASLIVGVGMSATLDEFLDSQRAGLASTYLTRLKLGPRLVDAAAVPELYSGTVRPRHLLMVVIAGLVALAAAIGVTPVGQEWADALGNGATDLFDSLQGLFS